MKMRRIIENMGETKTERLVCLCLCLMLAAQFTALCVLDMTVLPAYSDFDASSDFLRAAEMYRQGRIMPEHWVDTTMLHLDGSVPLAALLMGVTHDVFTAYGIANILLTALLLFAADRGLHAMGLSPMLRALGCNLLLCPYMMGRTEVNLLNYYTCVLGSAAYYLGIVILIFGCVWLWNSPECRDPKRYGRMAAGAALCLGAFISGVSRGVYLSMTCILPLLLCAVFFRDEKRRARLCWFGTLTVCNLAGKILTSRVLHFASRDSNVTLTNGNGVVQNLGAMLRGWFSLLDAMPEAGNIEVISRESVVWLPGAAVAILLLVCAVSGGVRAIRTLCREEPDGFLLPGVLFVWNVSVLLLTNSSYSGSFEDRYLLVVFMPALMCLLTALREGGKNVLLLLVAALGVCVGIRDVKGDVTVREVGYDTAWMEEAIAAADECPAPVVYYISKSDGLAVRYLRPMDENHVYRDIWNRDGSGVVVPERWKDGRGWVSSVSVNPPWGDDTRYIYAEEWDGPIRLIAADREIELLPQMLKEQFRPVKELSCGLLVYEADSNVLGAEPVEAAILPAA